MSNDVSQFGWASYSPIAVDYGSNGLIFGRWGTLNLYHQHKLLMHMNKINSSLTQMQYQIRKCEWRHFLSSNRWVYHPRRPRELKVWSYLLFIGHFKKLIITLFNNSLWTTGKLRWGHQSLPPNPQQLFYSSHYINMPLFSTKSTLSIMKLHWPH